MRAKRGSHANHGSQGVFCKIFPRGEGVGMQWKIERKFCEGRMGRLAEQYEMGR